jgi:hypothetical protein
VAGTMVVVELKKVRKIYEGRIFKKMNEKNFRTYL